MDSSTYSYRKAATTLRNMLEELLMGHSTFPGLATPNITAEEIENTVTSLLENLSLPIIEKLPADIIRAIIVASRQGYCPTNTLAHLMCAPVALDSFQFVSSIFNSEPRTFH